METGLTMAMLCEYASRKAELEEVKERLRELSSVYYPSAAQLTGTPGAHDDHSSENGPIRLAQLSAVYEGLCRELEWQTVAVELAIDSLPSLMRRVMRLYYIDGMDFSDIAQEIGYSRRHTKRLHDLAVVKLGIV